MKKTLSPSNYLLSASLLSIVAITSAFSQGLAPTQKGPRNKSLEFYDDPPAPVATASPDTRPLNPKEHSEKYDMPPAYILRLESSPRMISRFGPFTSYQANVDADGNNILGDAANEPSIAIDPTDSNKITIGWRQFNTVNSNFRQGGWGYTTDGGIHWTFPGVLENNVFRSDPVLDSNEVGTFFYLSLRDTFCDNIWQSTNGGQSWTNFPGTSGGDKQWFTVDKTGGPGHGFNTSLDRLLSLLIRRI